MGASISAGSNPLLLQLNYTKSLAGYFPEKCGTLNFDVFLLEYYQSKRFGRAGWMVDGKNYLDSNGFLDKNGKSHDEYKSVTGCNRSSL